MVNLMRKERTALAAALAGALGAEHEFGDLGAAFVVNEGGGDVGSGEGVRVGHVAGETDVCPEAGGGAAVDFADGEGHAFGEGGEEEGVVICPMPILMGGSGR